MSRNPWRPTVLAAFAFTWTAGAAVAADAPRGPFYVAEMGGAIHVLRDINGDGDALDTGERLPWAGGLGVVNGAATDGRHLYATDATNVVVRRLRDVNGDGDAFDTGESTVWADGFAPEWLGGIAVGPGGMVYVAGEGPIWRLSDTNGDGDALDAGEKTVYASGFGEALALLAQRDGSLLVSDLTRIHRLADLNGDGDALDVGESLPYTPGPGTPGRQAVSDCYGLLHDETGGFFASDGDDDVVYRVADLNVDGDAMDLLEVIRHADTVYGNLSVPAGMAPYGGGGFLLAENGTGRVSLVRDVTGDGDALDLGEVVTYADSPGAGFVVNLPDPGALGYNNVTLVEGHGGWNVTWDAPFVSYGDRAELGVERLRAALGDGPTSVATGAGGYNHEDGNLAVLASLDYTGAGTAALQLTAVGHVTIGQSLFSADSGDRLDLALEADVLDRGVGQVRLYAPVELGDGHLAAAGEAFTLAAYGSLVAGSAAITCPGGIDVDGTLTTGHHAFEAEGTAVWPGGGLHTGGGTISGMFAVEEGGLAACCGGVFNVTSPVPWTLAGECQLHGAALTGTPVEVHGVMCGMGESSVSSDLLCVGAATIDCPGDGDGLALEGVFGILEAATLTKTGDGVLVINGSQDHGPGACLDILGGTVEMDTDASGTGLMDDADLSILVADATLDFGCDQHVDTLEIGDGGLVRLTGANVVVVKNLVMNGIGLGAMTLAPEPATLALLAVGGLGVLLRKQW
jgi:hypothetical protein